MLVSGRLGNNTNGLMTALRFQVHHHAPATGFIPYKPTNGGPYSGRERDRQPRTRALLGVSLGS
jgi:hypothetical protein